MAKRRVRARRPGPQRQPAPRRARGSGEAAAVTRPPAVRTVQAEFPLDLAAVRDQLPREAMRWRYVVEHRKRWTNVEESAREVTRDAAQTLELLGLSHEQLTQLAQQTVVEVSIPYVSEEDSWPARLLPWEFLISSATRQMRGGGEFLIVRHLDFGAAGAARTPAKAAFIDAAPGNLAGQFDFEPEYKLVQQSFAEGRIAVSRIRNPTLPDLTAQLAALSPDIVHLSAIDIRMAREMAAEAAPSPTQRRQAERPLTSDKEEAGSLDGIVLHDLTSESFGEVRAAELGRALAAGKTPPLFVGFNTWYSASRVAPLALAAGVQAALSFSTDFSDPLAEMLFANFYRYWRLGNWNLLAGFLEAFKSLSGHASKLRGTGVVLWSRQSLVAPVPTVATAQGRRAGKARVAATKKQFKDLSEQAKKERNTDLLLPHEHTVHEIVSVVVQPLKRINYSLLHNNGNLFEQLVIRKSKPGRLRGFEVEVRLHVGQDSFPFRRTFDLVDEATPLHDVIRLPLTSSLIRRVDENLATTIYTRVEWAGQTLYEDTHRATLLPVDQWTDTDENRQWLPSFVLPRDPAIRRLLSSGQRYLMCLADDSGAGYDGYQQVDPRNAATLDAVDLQVRSMWTALLYEHPLAYINPPPSYEWTSQRLRTPSQVFGEGRGTCIDLALLLAACCEYVDIYPVLFLASGHAYPGYWRSEQGYAQFLSVQGVDGSIDQPDVVESRQSARPWIAGSSTYREILNHVAAGNLVPVETTLVTSHTSFSTAVAEGEKNLRQKSDFHSLIDIRLARDCGITPLPLGDLT